MHRVLAHIDRHLAGDLDLMSLAAVAHFSPFHLPRRAALRKDWLRWHATMPPIPEDATISLAYSVKDMPQR